MAQLPPSMQKTDPNTFNQTVVRIAHVLASDDFPPGDRAKLRRLSASAPPSVAFLRFAFAHLPEGWERRQELWQTLVAGVALMYPQQHDASRPLGRALAEAGYAEARLERLLAAQDDTRRTLLLRAIRFLRAKNMGCRFSDFAHLLGLGDNPEAASQRIARDYFRALSTQS